MNIRATALLVSALVVAVCPLEAVAASPILTVLAPHKKKKKPAAPAPAPAPSPKKADKAKQAAKPVSE